MTGRDRITDATYQITLALYWTFHIHHNGLGDDPEILFPHGDPDLAAPNTTDCIRLWLEQRLIHRTTVT